MPTFKKISLVTMMTFSLWGSAGPSAHAENSANSTGALSTKAIASMLDRLATQNPNDLLAAQVQSMGLAAALTDPALVLWHQRPFTVELEKIGGIADQANSGDCWIYATLNVYKSSLISTGKVTGDFEYSKNFVYFYSMIEKVNTYLEQLIAERVQSISSKKFRKDFRLADDTPEYLIADGGEFA